jgi:hypothetical protein
LKCSTVTSFGNRDHGLTDLARDAAALIKAVGGSVTVFSPLFGGQIDQVQRRETLLARKVSRGYQPFNIRLQGEGETVFMDI